MAQIMKVLKIEEKLMRIPNTWICITDLLKEVNDGLPKRSKIRNPLQFSHLILRLRGRQEFIIERKKISQRLDPKTSVKRTYFRMVIKK